MYWQPVHALLEDRFEVIVGNAHHIKNVPGRKTDVKDSEWLADLARHGLIAKSFVPAKPLRQLRDLVRYRRKLVESRTAERNRLLKLLETANIKLASVVTDVFGVSGMRMLRALVDGQATPEQMAGLAKGVLRRKTHDLALALEGRVEDHHRFLLRLQLERLARVESDVARVEAQIDASLTPYQEPCRRLEQIPGVHHVLAATLIAEVGVDMTVFHSARHLAAWAGVCPGNHESAGKQKTAPARKGNVHLRTALLRTALVDAAMAASHKNGSYLKDKFHRLRARRGTKRAAMAIGHKILVAVYHMLANCIAYKDLGGTYLDHLDQRRVTRNLVRRLERLGYDVKIEPRAA